MEDSLIVPHEAQAAAALRAYAASETASPGCTRAALLDRVIRFLVGVGLDVRISPGAEGFLRQVRIAGGALLVDPGCRPSDVLHEAGHLAILPAEFRHQAEDDLMEVIELVLESTERHSDPDSAPVRAALNCDEVAATAWAFAAGLAIGMQPDEIVLDDEYGGEGASVRLALQLGSFEGIHSIAQAGFCCTKPQLERVFMLPAYPKLVRWLQL